MKIWTEASLKPVMDELEYLHGSCREFYGAIVIGEATFTRIKHEIEDGAQELDYQTIYGFAIGDLVPLAAILRAKGVRPEEITDWRKDLQGLMDFVAEQEMEAHQKAVADVLKRFEGPDKETGEWFVKGIGRKGTEK